MIALPRIMVAPNGARRTRADHPALPVTIPEIVETARACHAAGAGGVHAHVRDEAGRHSLDAGLYRELIAELNRSVPELFVQITSEAAGRYAPFEQRALIRELAPGSVSVATREILPDDGERDAARALYHWAAEAEVAIHHIAYSRSELERILELIAEGLIPGRSHHLMLVLGSYDGSTASDPADIDRFIAPLAAAGPDLSFDWMLCAFGRNETVCLVKALSRGGKARVGFENSLWNADGSIARDNAERVAELVAAAGL